MFTKDVEWPDLMGGDVTPQEHEPQTVWELRELDASTIAGLMRLGYILRCLDEALWTSPAVARSCSGEAPASP